MSIKLTNHRDSDGRIYRMWGPFQFGKVQHTGKWLVLNSAGKVLEADTLESAKSELERLLNRTDFKATANGTSPFILTTDNGTHCPKCGQRHTQECVDSGRCMNCQVMLCGILPD